MGVFDGMAGAPVAHLFRHKNEIDFIS